MLPYSFPRAWLSQRECTFWLLVGHLEYQILRWCHTWESLSRCNRNPKNQMPRCWYWTCPSGGQMRALIVCCHRFRAGIWLFDRPCSLDQARDNETRKPIWFYYYGCLLPDLSWLFWLRWESARWDLAYVFWTWSGQAEQCLSMRFRTCSWERVGRPLCWSYYIMFEMKFKRLHNIHNRKACRWRRSLCSLSSYICHDLEILEG